MAQVPLTPHTHPHRKRLDRRHRIQLVHRRHAFLDPRPRVRAIPRLTSIRYRSRSQASRSRTPPATPAPSRASSCPARPHVIEMLEISGMGSERPPCCMSSHHRVSCQLWYSHRACRTPHQRRIRPRAARHARAATHSLHPSVPHRCTHTLQQSPPLIAQVSRTRDIATHDPTTAGAPASAGPSENVLACPPYPTPPAQL